MSKAMDLGYWKNNNYFILTFAVSTTKKHCWFTTKVTLLYLLCAWCHKVQHVQNCFFPFCLLTMCGLQCLHFFFRLKKHTHPKFHCKKEIAKFKNPLFWRLKLEVRVSLWRRGTNDQSRKVSDQSQVPPLTGSHDRFKTDFPVVENETTAATRRTWQRSSAGFQAPGAHGAAVSSRLLGENTTEAPVWCPETEGHRRPLTVALWRRAVTRRAVGCTQIQRLPWRWI